MNDELVCMYMAVKNRGKGEFTFVDKIVRKYWFRYPWIDIDELISEANLALVIKAEEFLVKKPNCDFKVFAYSRIDGALKDFLRSCNWITKKGKTQFRMYLVSSEKLAEKSDSSFSENGFIDDMILASDKEYLGKLIRFLSGPERRVIDYVMKGFSLKSISLKTGMTLYRVREAYRSALESIYEYAS